jgi:hypothetical protein
VAVEVAQAQTSLARAVARARAGEDYELAQKVRERGETTSKLLAGLLKLNKVHTADNTAFDVPVTELARAIRELVDLLGTVHLVAVQDQVYVNDIRIPTGSGASGDLSAQLATHNAGGLTFHAALAPEAVRAIVSAFATAPAAQLPRHALQRSLFARGVKTVELTPRVRYIAEDDEKATTRNPLEAMGRALQLVAETYDNVAAGRVLNVLPLRRAVSEFLELGPEAPVLWDTVAEGLPHASHAVTVALVALLMGKGAGLRVGMLQDLGLAGLIHDVGYASLPANAPAAEGLARHPGEAVRILLRQRGFHVAKLRRLRAVLDHHRDHADPRGRPSILGELLRLAEDYATLVRVAGAKGSPAHALAAIARGAGRLYHPALAQLLVNVLGRYPPGTLVELADGRMARSASPARSAQTFAAPLVHLLDPRTKTFSRDLLDLAVAGPAVRRALPG